MIAAETVEVVAEIAVAVAVGADGIVAEAAVVDVAADRVAVAETAEVATAKPK